MAAVTALQPGQAWPLGATVDGDGVNFAVGSSQASAIELCLYDDAGLHETARLPLPARSGDICHGRLAGAGAGLVYGLRAHGPWQPLQGQRFNAHKLLLDPYARETVGGFVWSDVLRGHAGDDPLRIDTRDSGAAMVKARVVGDDRFAWQGDAPPRTPWADSVLYELHVRGFSMQHPGVPPAERGSYAGLASGAAIAHLQRLGVTALSLMPVQQFIDEERLVRLGLRNHWGYNTLAYFCPEPRYAASAAAGGRAVRDEFRHMVRRLHAAGIEVILDVVYNHTAETDEFGPTLSWRGLDNAGWYRLQPAAAHRYDNPSGCGNALDLSRPAALRMVMDSLRYWVHEMHVDGFRFDLATVLGRARDGFDPAAAFFACIAQDPVLAGIKLIAEPWDLGPGGYRLGQFPAGWAEWNDRFRDGMRAFWLRGEGTRGEFARRLCASSDFFQQRRRAPAASMNYVVAHDGFSLRDLASYDQRHNEANGEHNRDGQAHNLSWNCGVEGETGDAQVLATRGALQRALLATLLLAQGTPMLAMGAELGHSQQGNNNAYCQDNAISWIDWSRIDAGLLDFAAACIAARRRWRPLDDDWLDDAAVRWLGADGKPLQPADWQRGDAPALGLLLQRDPDAALLLVNAGADALAFQLPAGRWQRVLDSAAPAAGAVDAGTTGLAARSLCLLQAAPTPQD